MNMEVEVRGKLYKEDKVCHTAYVIAFVYS